MSTDDARTLQLRDIVTLLDDKDAQGEIIKIAPTAVYVKWIEGPIGIYPWGGTAMQFIIKREGLNAQQSIS